MGSDGSEHAVVGDSNAGWAGCFAACTQLTLRHNYGTNRILGLMKWDMLAFASCSALFFAILVALRHRTGDCKASGRQRRRTTSISHQSLGADGYRGGSYRSQGHWRRR